MLTDDQLASLDEAWTPARAAGVIGTAPVEALVEHTVWFARAVCSSFSASFDEFHGRIVDVGTGAGLPGVILAALLPHAELRLVDASERRLDHARRASRALGVGDRVEIAHGRGDELAHDAAWRGIHDVRMPFTFVRKVVYSLFSSWLNDIFKRFIFLKTFQFIFTSQIAKLSSIFCSFV